MLSKIIKKNILGLLKQDEPYRYNIQNLAPIFITTSWWFNPHEICHKTLVFSIPKSKPIFHKSSMTWHCLPLWIVCYSFCFILTIDNFHFYKRFILKMEVRRKIILCLLMTITMGCYKVEGREPILHRVGGGRYTWTPKANFTNWSSHENFYQGDWLCKCFQLINSINSWLWYAGKFCIIYLYY